MMKAILVLFFVAAANAAGTDPVPGVGLPAGAGHTQAKITFSSGVADICKTPTAEETFEADTPPAEVLKKASELLKAANSGDEACQQHTFTKMLLVKGNADVTAKQIKDIESDAKEVCVKVKLE